MHPYTAYFMLPAFELFLNKIQVCVVLCFAAFISHRSAVHAHVALVTHCHCCVLFHEPVDHKLLSVSHG